MTTRPRAGERGSQRYKTAVIRLLRDQDVADTENFILSGQYAEMSAEMALRSRFDQLGHVLRSYDLFICILEGYAPSGTPLDVAYRIAVFRVFVRERSVFNNWRIIVQVALELEDTNPFLTIVAANVPARTWLEMVEGVAMAGYDDDALRIIYTYMLTFARRIVPLAMVDSMQPYVAPGVDLERNAPYAITVGTLGERGEALPDAGRLALQNLLTAERRAICLRELRAFAIGIIGMHLSTYFILHLSREVVPCFDHYTRGDVRYIVSDGDAVAVIEDVRAQQAAAEARRAQQANAVNDADE
jgi:hypothetical protein